MPSRTLRILGEALLNATLMLIALILALVVVLVVQLRGLGSDLRADLAGLRLRQSEVHAQVEQALDLLDAATAERDGSLPESVARARQALAGSLAGSVTEQTFDSP